MTGTSAESGADRKMFTHMLSSRSAGRHQAHQEAERDARDDGEREAGEVAADRQPRRGGEARRRHHLGERARAPR